LIIVAMRVHFIAEVHRACDTKTGGFHKLFRQCSIPLNPFAYPPFCAGRTIDDKSTSENQAPHIPGRSACSRTNQGFARLYSVKSLRRIMARI
jgi:hypothetical protein